MRRNAGTIPEWELPEGWRVVASPVPNAEELDAALRIEDDPESDDIESWAEIEETASGRRVLLRMVHQVRDRRLVPAGVHVSGVVVLPREPGGRVTAADIRFPLRSIEDAAIRQHLPGLASPRSRHDAQDYEPPAPVGRPDGTEGFYGRVAQLWFYFNADRYPTKRVAEVNGVSLQTAQRWVTEARRQGWLPAGIRGRAK